MRALVTIETGSKNEVLTLMMASAQVVETSVNTNNSPSQDYTTNPDDHSNHNEVFDPAYPAYFTLAKAKKEVMRT